MLCQGWMRELSATFHPFNCDDMIIKLLRKKNAFSLFYGGFYLKPHNEAKHVRLISLPWHTKIPIKIQIT